MTGSESSLPRLVSCYHLPGARMWKASETFNENEGGIQLASSYFTYDFIIGHGIHWIGNKYTLL